MIGKEQEATQKLQAWLGQMSNPFWDPWTQYSIKSWGDTKEEEEEKNVGIDPTEDHPENIKYSYQGKRDANGHFDVYGTLTYENGDVVTSEYVHGVKEV